MLPDSSSTFPVLNRRSLMFGIDSDLAYALLFSAVMVYSRSHDSLLVTATYLAGIWFLALKLTGKDPDLPRYAVLYLLAPRHWDAARKPKAVIAATLHPQLDIKCHHAV